MPAHLLFLAAAGEEFQKDVMAARKGGQFSAHEMLIAITIGVVIGLVLFAWTYLRFRKQRREARGRGVLVETEVRPKSPKRDEIDPETGEPVRRRIRKRRRRRDHRPRNPTLDKTGGLPPPRPEDELPKF